MKVFCVAIMAPENPQPLDTADLPLLMSLDQLKNPAPKNANVSFLRRTQYISAGVRAPDGPKPTPTRVKPRFDDKSKSQDDPAYIKRYIQKGFDLAYPESRHTGEETASKIKGHTPTKAEQDAWAKPVHPDNPKLKPVGFFPVLPDLQGFPDPGGFVQFKFDKAPVHGISGKRNKTMDVAILLPSAPEERICQEHATKVALHKTNPKLYPDPGPIPWDYDLFLPEKKEAAQTQNVINSLNLSNPDRGNQALYTHEGPDENKFHRYDRVRTYATSAQTLGNDNKQRDIALTIFDPAQAKEDQQDSEPPKQKGAYYYPILGKTRLKPERARTIAQAGLAPAQSQTREDQVDQLQVSVRDPDEAEIYKRALHRAAIDPKYVDSMPPPPAGAEEEQEEAPREEEGAAEQEPNQEQEQEASGEREHSAQPAAEDDEE